MDRLGQRMPGPDGSLVDRIAAAAEQGGDRHGLYAVVTEEAARLVGSGAAVLVGLENGGPATVLARWSAAEGDCGPDAAFPLDELTRAIVTTREPRRQDVVVGVPVLESGVAWAVLYAVAATAERPPAAAESQLGTVARLLAMAVSGCEGRAALEETADRRAAVRRI